jgi:hypothetical protein
LVLSIGIEFGSLREGGRIKEVKRFGAAKILALRGRDVSEAQHPEGNDHGSESNVVIQEPVRTIKSTTTRLQSESVPARKKASDADVQGKELSRIDAPQIRYQYTTKAVPVQSETRTYSYVLARASETDVNWKESEKVTVPGPLRVEALGDRLAFENCTVRIYRDMEAEASILNFTHQVEADMIALGPHGPRGMEHFLHGNMAGDIVNHSSSMIWTSVMPFAIRDY